MLAHSPEYFLLFSRSVLSDSLQPHRLQHTRLPCPSPSPEACLNSCSWNQWCHSTISLSVVPFSSCLQPFPASGSFPMSQFFCIRWPKYWSFSFSISPSNEFLGLISFRIGWFDLLAVQGLSRDFSRTSSKASILQHSGLFTVQFSHPYMTTGKTIALTVQTNVLLPNLCNNRMKQAQLLYPLNRWGNWDDLKRHAHHPEKKETAHCRVIQGHPMFIFAELQCWIGLFVRRPMPGAMAGGCLSAQAIGPNQTPFLSSNALREPRFAYVGWRFSQRHYAFVTRCYFQGNGC